MKRKGIECETGKPPRIQIIDNLLCDAIVKLSIKLNRKVTFGDLNRDQQDAIVYMNEQWTGTKTMLLGTIYRERQ
jgi:hypothetical protein